MMTIRPYTLVLLFLIVVAGYAAPKTAAEIYQQFRPILCHVTYYQNVAMHSKIGSYMKIKQHRNGILVNDRGLVMVSSDVYPLSLDIMTGGASFFSGEPTDFEVELSTGKKYKASFVGKDDQAGVAFLQMELPPNTTVPFITFQPDTLAPGTPVFVLELLTSRYQFQPAIQAFQINARIDKPNLRYIITNAQPQLSSCGLVLTADGHAIGITRGASLDNALLSEGLDEYRPDYIEIIPAGEFMPLIQHPPVISRKTFRGRAWLGIIMQALTPELKTVWKVPTDGGVVINKIYEKSPAQAAGLKPGDVIIALNGEQLPITKSEDLDIFRNRILQQKPGSTVTLKIFRKGKILTKTVRLAAAPRSIDLAEKYQLPELGFEVRELTPGVLYENDLPLNTKGVYVYRVDRASPAGLGGLDIGEIILQVNGRPVENIARFRTEMTAILKQNPRKIVFFVRDGRDTRFVFITPR